jgi:hypothetical protein
LLLDVVPVSLDESEMAVVDYLSDQALFLAPLEPSDEISRLCALSAAGLRVELARLDRERLADLDRQ